MDYRDRPGQALLDAVGMLRALAARLPRLLKLLVPHRRTPLERARAAARVLNRKGHLKRRRRPPRPDESHSGGANWGYDTWTGNGGRDGSTDSSGGGGGSY